MYIPHEYDLGEGGGDLHGLQESRGMSHGLDDALHALAGGGVEDLFRGVAAGLGVDRDTAEGGDEIEFALVHVHNEHAGAAGDFEPLRDEVADGAGAKDGRVVAGLHAHLAHAVEGDGGGLGAGGVQQGHMGGHGQEVALGHDDELAHAPVAAGAVVVVVFGLGVVAGVEGFFAGLGNQREDGDAVAFFAGDAIGLDHAGELVAEHERVMVGAAFKRSRNVAAAHAAGGDAHEHGVFNAEPDRRRGRERAVGVIDEVAVGFENEGAHGR